MNEVTLHTPPPIPGVDLLTRREREILVMLAQMHLTHQDIAEQLFLATNSIKWYTRQIYAKLGVNDRKQAIARAVELGLVELSRPTTIPLPTHNLPIPITSFVGREKDVDKIGQMLADPALRLITLLGSGGVGKTRLAIKVAEEQQAAYPQGVWFVELAALAQGYLVPERTAAVFGFLGNEKQDPITALKIFLRPAKLLLVLDNCEHLIDDCAQMIDHLLQICPYLKVMVTSRQALGIMGETIYIVPPLQVPDLERPPDADEWGKNEAIRFFAHRALAVKRNFRVTQHNQKALAFICHKLEGIPLALELAASRLKVLEIEQIADHLESSFQLLSGGGRTAPRRHQTMEASIEWSYSLLSAAEQHMFQQLAIFNGGWTLEAAQAVCVRGLNDTLSGTEIIDLLAQLMDKSLVSGMHQKFSNLESNDEPLPSKPYRYRMLEPIQQYARQKLRDASGEPKVLEDHLAYFLALAETAAPFFRGPHQAEWFARLEDEIDNLRLALEWALKTNLEAELRLGSALIWFWHIQGHWAEGLKWIQKGLGPFTSSQKSTLRFPLDIRIRAKALSAAGYLQSGLLLQQNNSKAFDQVFALFQESLTISRDQRPEDRQGMAFALLQLARAAVGQLDMTEVIAWANQSLALYREAEDAFGISECLLILAINESNPARVKEAFQETLKIKRRIKDLDGVAFALAHASALAIFEGDYARANTDLMESLAYFRKVNNLIYITRALCSLAWIDWVQAKPQEALLHIEEALLNYRTNQRTDAFAQILLLRSEILLSLENWEEAHQDILEALEIGQNLGSPALIAAAEQLQGKIAWLQSDLHSAMHSLESALVISCKIERQDITAGTLSVLGQVKCVAGETTIGKSLLLESLQKYFNLYSWRNGPYLAYPLTTLASLAVAEQKMERATSLYAHAQRIFPLLVNTLTPRERVQRENDLSQIKTILGQDRFQQCWQTGVKMPMGEIIAAILQDQYPPQ
jgi:predicted ATPase/DNA-binding CsgD family transcriptional regulator